MYVESYVIHKAFADMFLEHGLLGFLVVGNSVNGNHSYFQFSQVGRPKVYKCLVTHY